MRSRKKLRLTYSLCELVIPCLSSGADPREVEVALGEVAAECLRSPELDIRRDTSVVTLTCLSDWHASRELSSRVGVVGVRAVPAIQSLSELELRDEAYRTLDCEGYYHPRYGHVIEWALTMDRVIGAPSEWSGGALSKMKLFEFLGRFDYRLQCAHGLNNGHRSLVGLPVDLQRFLKFANIPKP